MSQVTCPHCGKMNADAGAFCQACGKALPEAAPTGPQIIGGAGLAGTTTGRLLQSGELEREAKKAARALFWVAVLQAIFGTVMVFILGKDLADDELAILAVTVYTIAVVFLGLYFWARKHPLPAAIVGLLLFITLHLVDAVADPTALTRGLLVKVVIIVVLIRAISAGARYRRLKRQEA